MQPRTDEDSYVRLFEELGRLHTAFKAVWEPSPPEPLDDHRTFSQLRYSVGFTRRRLGRRSEPVVHRMRQLTGELSKLRKEVELPCAPIHGDYKLGNAGELSDGSWATFDLDFARVRERMYDIAASLHQVAPSGELLEPRRLLDAYEEHGSGTIDSRRVPMAPRGSSPCTPALGCHRRARGRRHPRGRRRDDRRRGLLVAPG